MTTGEVDHGAYCRAFGAVSLICVIVFAVLSVLGGHGGGPVLLIVIMLAAVGASYGLMLLVGRRHVVLAHAIVWVLVSAVYLAMGTINMRISAIEIFYSLLLGAVTIGIVSLMALMAHTVFK